MNNKTKRKRKRESIAEIEIIIDAPSWRDALPECESITCQTVQTVLEHLEVSTMAIEVSLVLANDALIQEKNKRYRGKDQPTNVLAFPAMQNPLNWLSQMKSTGTPFVIGDIFLAIETIQQEASAQAKPLQDHFSHLIVHGVLHLFGYDHQVDGDAEKMEALEIKILGEMGIKNPYLTGE